MKIKLLILLFLFSGLLINGQEIKLKSSIVANAGTNLELSNVNISKWRLGEVHLIVLQREKNIDLLENSWTINSYPNPFTTVLNLDFQSNEKNEFTILVTDIQGKKQMHIEQKTILPNEVIQLNLAGLSPALYLVTIIPKDQSFQKVFKVQKQ